MNINIIFVSLLALSLWGCSDDSAKVTALPEPTLDTAPVKHTGTFPLDEWNGAKWIDSGQSISLETTWRFIGSVEVDTGLKVSGGYTIKFTNPTNRVVEVGIIKLKFYDNVDITIAEYDIIPDDTFNIDPSEEITRNGTFEITVGSLEVTELITEMGIWAYAGFKR